MAKINDVNEAVSVLIQAANIGQKAGAFELNEASLIQDAIDFLVPSQDEDETDESNEENEETKNTPSYVNKMKPEGDKIENSDKEIEY